MSVLTSGQNWQYAIGSLCVEIMFCLVLILLVRALFDRMIGPVGCRLLWAVLIVRCLVPVSIPSQHHPVTHLIKAYEQRKTDKIEAATIKPAEIRAATVMERLPSVENIIIDQPPSVVPVDIQSQVTIPIEIMPVEIAPIEPPVEIEPVEIKTATVMERSPAEEIAADVAVIVTQPVVSQPVTATKRVHLGGILFGVWAVGFVTFLVMAIARNRRMVRAACQSPETVPDWMQAMFLECRAQLKIRTWPVLIISRNVKTPCLVGAIRPRVLVPKQLLDDSHGDAQSVGSATAMRYIFLHELTHLKQGDIWLSWCWTLVMALHWFNPLLWWVGRLVGFDCETACDFRVLERLEPGQHTSYGRSLFEILQKLNSPVVRSPGFSAVIEGKTNFERRLIMITNYRKRTLQQTLAGGVILTLLLVASLTTFAQQEREPISPDKAKMIGYVEDYFMNNYRDITMRKSLEWGDITTDEQGNSTIRYKFEALIWDKDRMIMCEDFIFDKDGRYVSAKKVEGFPQEKGNDNTPVAGPDASPEDAAASQKLAQEGWQLFMQGNAVDAEKKFKEAVEKNPKNANAYQGLGWAQLNGNKPDEAKKAFERCVALDAKNTAALNGLGRIAYFNDDDEDAAIKHWEKAVSLDKQATGPMMGLAQLYNHRGDYENAVKYYKIWLKSEPQNEDAKKGLQDAQNSLNNTASPVEDGETYQRLLKLQEALYQAKQQLLIHDKTSSNLNQIFDRERKELNQKLESMEESERIKTMDDFNRRHGEGVFEYSLKRQEIEQSITEIENQLEHEKAVAQLKRDFGPGSQQNTRQPVPATPQPKSANNADKDKAAKEFLDFVCAGKYDEAYKMTTPVVQNAMSIEKMRELFESVQKTMGKIEGGEVTSVTNELGFRATYAGVTLEKATMTLKIVIDDDAKITGFFIVGVLPRTDKAEEKKATSQIRQANIVLRNGESFFGNLPVK